MPDLIDEAYELGREHGAAAGTWAADGNTSDEHRRRVLAMMADGDPAADDYLPTMPDLSGEWADGLTPGKLYEQVTGSPEPVTPDEDDAQVIEALANAYEEGVAHTFYESCERELRGGLSDEAA